MAYIAIHDGEQKGAFEVPHQTDAFCPECGERMRVWRESEDGTARHFKHVSEMHGSQKAGGGNSCSGGEGHQHRKWKNFAAERLAEAFDGVAETTVEKRLHAPHTDKDYRDADAVVTFKKPDDQLGIGLAAEVQHKNDQKDIAATTRDYLKQDIAVAWLDQNDFSDTGCRMNETDFRDRASQAVSPGIFGAGTLPYGHPPKHHVAPILNQVRNHRADLNMSECDHTLKNRAYYTPATIPAEYFDEQAQLIWELTAWDRIFDPPRFSDPDIQSKKEVPAKFPAKWSYRKHAEVVQPETPSVENHCADGWHIPTWEGTGRVCEVCGLSSQTITDWLGHDFP